MKTMSVATNADYSRVAPIKKEKPTSDVRYTFKTTGENKTENATVNLNEKQRQTIRDLVVQNGRWRSDAQFMVDAIVHYLNDESQTLDSPMKIISGTEWNCEASFTFAITKTLFNEIDLMVNHAHTPWYSKQAFYICAIRSYSEADYPVVNHR